MSLRSCLPAAASQCALLTHVTHHTRLPHVPLVSPPPTTNASTNTYGLWPSQNCTWTVIGKGEGEGVWSQLIKMQINCLVLGLTLSYTCCLGITMYTHIPRFFRHVFRGINRTQRKKESSLSNPLTHTHPSFLPSPHSHYTDYTAYL